MSHKRLSQLNFPSKVHFPSKALSSSFQIEIMTYFSLQVEENATFFFWPETDVDQLSLENGKYCF